MSWKDDFPIDSRYFETENGILYNGDVFEVLKNFPEGSIDCVITSPPYWALRDYGVEGQIGLEKDFNEYLEKLWRVFDEIYRILKPTGTVWVNLGDTYMNNSSYSSRGRRGFNPKEGMIYKSGSVKQKSLCLIPERFAIGMVERGWILRNVIIWHKPNPMPESVKDRFTVDFEYIYFFVKQKKYYFEQQFEPIKDDFETYKKKLPKSPTNKTLQEAGRGIIKYRDTILESYWKGRNKRTTWSITTKPFPEAHFAVFPPEIPETCIKAGCPEGGVVLDPFIGSGTTAVVAEKLKRKWVGIELNPEYCKIAEKRIKEETKQMKLF